MLEKIFGNKEDFCWITATAYREIVKSDFEEARVCYENCAYKAYQIILGSVMEGVLSYGLTAMRMKFEESATLAELIELAKKHSLLLQAEAYLGQAVRDYRNLCHPKKQISEKRKITKESADMARQACEYVIREIKEKFTTTPVTVDAYLISSAVVRMNDSTIQQRETIPLRIMPFSLGHNPDNSCIVSCAHAAEQQEHVSKKHAQITFAQGAFYLEDLDSRNGTYILKGEKEEKVKHGKPALLFPGTRFRLAKKPGDPEFTFYAEGEVKTAAQ